MKTYEIYGTIKHGHKYLIGNKNNGKRTRFNLVPVRCLENGKEYKCINDAVEDLKITRNMVGRSLRGQKTKYTFERINKEDV